MKLPFIFSFAFLFGITSTNSCQKKNTDLPYPSLSEQRNLLANKPHPRPVRILDSSQIIKDLEYLASAECEGRRPGTKGHAKAHGYILSRMRSAGLDSFNNSLVQTFSGKMINGTTEGKNVVGWVKGTTTPGKYVVITAHYDHLGIKDGSIYYGADDNASGVASLLALAKYFKQQPQPYSLIFVALDREETGLEGAYKFLENIPSSIKVEDISFNLNMDMIARSDKNEIFACGVSHNPSLKYLVDSVQNKTNVKLLMGHDTGSGFDDWTTQSDHLAFHKKKIPFMYIGVEDHADYHQRSDSFDKVNYSRFIENCNLVALITKALKI